MHQPQFSIAEKQNNYLQYTIQKKIWDDAQNIKDSAPNRMSNKSDNNDNDDKNNNEGHNQQKNSALAAASNVASGEGYNVGQDQRGAGKRSKAKRSSSKRSKSKTGKIKQNKSTKPPTKVAKPYDYAKSGKYGITWNG